MYTNEIGKASGIDIYGKQKTFKAETIIIGTHVIYASNNDLITLEILEDENVTIIHCWDNNLTELILPKKIEKVFCDKNKLSTLALPNGIKSAFCIDNNLKELDLPDSLMLLRCDKELFDYDTCNVKYVDIIYPHVTPSRI